MVEDDYYNSIKYKYDDIKSLDIIKFFYVYRLAHDNIPNYSSTIYQENNKLISS